MSVLNRCLEDNVEEAACLYKANLVLQFIRLRPANKSLLDLTNQPILV
jgi:hypothetical protein